MLDARREGGGHGIGVTIKARGSVMSLVSVYIHKDQEKRMRDILEGMLGRDYKLFMAGGDLNAIPGSSAVRNFKKWVEGRRGCRLRWDAETYLMGRCIDHLFTSNELLAGGQHLITTLIHPFDHSILFHDINKLNYKKPFAIPDAIAISEAFAREVFDELELPIYPLAAWEKVRERERDVYKKMKNREL